MSVRSRSFGARSFVLRQRLVPVAAACSWALCALALCVPQAVEAQQEAPEPSARSEKPGREIAVVVDTSSSMRRQDPRRYTVQTLRILADLLSAGDVLTAIRMPPSDHCGARPNPGLALRLDIGGHGGERSSDHRAFEQAIDRHLAFKTGTYFAASLRTAMAALDASKARRRLLLVLADAGGLGRCSGALTPELVAARGRGVQLAAVHLGRGRGAFAGHPAFESTATARDAEELVGAVALIYQRLLGVKQVQTGRVVDRRIEATVAAHIERAFLVVAADGEVGPVRPVAGDRTGLAPGEIDDSRRGATVGLDGRRRTYRIVRLEGPVHGEWRFELPDLGDVAGWMLVQESALAVRVVDGGPLVVGEPARLVVELYDRVTGGRVESLPDLELSVDGVPLRDDGRKRSADRVAGDGLYSALLGPARAGAEYTVRLRGGPFDQDFAVTPEAQEGKLVLAAPPALDFGAGVLAAGDVAESTLDLSATEIVGRVRLRLGSDFGARRVALEIDGGRGFERLDGAVLEPGDSHRRFPVRVRVASCPQAVPADHKIWLESAGPEAQRVEAPLRLRVRAEPWLHCWWPVLALGAGAVALAVTAHGLVVPSRFPPRAGLQLAQEEALDEGFFHPFRAQRGSGSGFYRDARLYLHADYRLSPAAAGALARVRAEGSAVALLPLAELERRTADGAWERLEASERRLRPGVAHRVGELHFELRHG